MEIKKVSDSIKISSKHASLLVYPNDKTKGADVDIVLGKGDDSAVEIVSPGEYETKEAWIMAFNTDVNEEESNVYVLTVEGINVCILGEKVKKLTKPKIEKIGLIDIAIVKSEENELKTLIDNVSEIDPQILIPIDFKKEDFDKLTKDLGVKNIEEEKKIKVKMEDFSNEDFQLKIITL